MIKFILLASLLACAQSSSTTITISSCGETSITTNSDGASCPAPSSVASGPSASNGAPTAAEISLIREVYPLIRTKKILVRVVVDHFKSQPRIQQLLPQPYASMPLDQLQQNEAFNQQAYANMLLATDFIVNNLDNVGHLANHLRRLDNYNSRYVDFIDQKRQLGETVRIFSNAVNEELSDQLTSEAKNAFRKALVFAFGFMGTATSTAVSGKSVLSASELSLVRSTFDLIKDNVKLAENIMMKHFVLHAPVQKLFPTLANIPLADLANSEEFHIQAYIALRATHYIVNNLDNDELMTVHLKRINSPQFFVDYMDPLHQFDETTRLILEGIQEELGSAFTAKAAAALQKAFDHVTDIMTADASVAFNGAPLDTSVKRCNSGCPGIPVQVKALVRDTWALARRNANIAPKLFLKMFATHPDTQKMFPRFASVPVDELPKNQYFLQQSYNCLFGLTVIIKNMENPNVIATLLKDMASPSFYVDGPSPGEQLDETTRLFHEVMYEELGEVYTYEVKDAFSTLFAYVNQVLVKANDDTILSEADKQVMRDSMKVVQKQNNNIGSKILLKLIKAHPQTQKLFGGFAKVKLADLPNNTEFKAYGNMMTAGLNFMVDNLDDTRAIRQIISSRQASNFFVPNVSIRQQLEETFRVAIEAISEELGPRFTNKTKIAFTRGLRFLNQVQDESFRF